MRIGIGYDIHRLAEDRKLQLGGVEIPYVKGLISYTDGDVLIHAIADSILGAMGSGDIGQHFSNTDPRYEGMASGEILKKVIGLMDEKRFTLKNIDSVIIAEEPKIYPFKEKMIDFLVPILKIDRNCINIKATTNEGVGSLGKGEAIAAYAVALIASAGDLGT